MKSYFHEYMLEKNIILYYIKMRCAVCCWAKNEDKIIREWVAHYLNLGFDRIRIFDNLSNIPIASYIKHPNVKITIDDNSKGWGQIPRYNEFLNENRDCDWVFCCDVDEFLSLRIHNDLKSLLCTFPSDTSVIPVNWVTFGQGNREKLDVNQLVIEQFTIREEYDCFWNFFTKCLIRPNLIQTLDDFHFQDSGIYETRSVYNKVIKREGLLSMAEKEEFKCRLNNDTPLVLHHYMTLDKESMAEKRQRLQIMISETNNKYTNEWYHLNFKDNIEDHSMKKYIHCIKTRIKELE